MGLFDWVKGQFVEVIEWPSQAGDVLSWRFPAYTNAIKNGASLTVREGQVAVFLNQGKAVEVFAPGAYILNTKTIPVLTSFEHLGKLGESPFKADVVFVTTRRFPDLKWGTLNPVMLRDADFGVLRLRAFGTYALRVTDPKAYVTQLTGTDNQTGVAAVQDHLRNKIVARFTDSLGESKIAALDLASRYDELSQDLERRLNLELAQQGMGVTDLHIENISLPPEVEKALDARSKMNVLGDLNKYTQLQTADSIQTAAANPGIGGAGVGMGVGAGIGMAMGQQMANAMQPRPAAPDAFAAPVAGAAAPTAAAGAAAGATAGTPKFCHQCGTPLPAGAKFCANCGTKVGG